MTNFEHIMENPELVKKLVLGKLAVKNGEAHNCIPIDINGENIRGLKCQECDLHDKCARNREKWLNAEYKPVIKLTKREKAFLDSINDVIKYLARDDNGYLYVFSDKPKAFSYQWEPISGSICYQVSKLIHGELFSFVKWGDKEPTSIEWLRTLDVEEGVPDE